MNDYEKEFLLKQHEARCRCFCDSNNASIEFSKMALRGAFLLNGMAAVACIYGQKITINHLISLIEYFSIGALFAAIAAGATYLTQLRITESWRRYLFEPPAPSVQELHARNQEQYLDNNIVRVLRITAIALVLGSYFCFGFGAYYGYHALHP